MLHASVIISFMQTWPHAVQRLLTETSGVVGVAAGWRVWPAHFTLVLPRPWAACAPAIGSPKGATRYKVNQLFCEHKTEQKFANYCIGRFPGSSLRYCDFFPRDQSVAFTLQYLVFFTAFSNIHFVNFSWILFREIFGPIRMETLSLHIFCQLLRICGSKQPGVIVSESRKF